MAKIVHFIVDSLVVIPTVITLLSVYLGIKLSKDQPHKVWWGWHDPSEWTGLNCSSASFGWFFLLGFLVVLSIKSGQQTGVQTYP